VPKRERRKNRTFSVVIYVIVYTLLEKFMTSIYKKFTGKI